MLPQSSAILELLAGKDQTLLIRRDALLVLDLGLITHYVVVDMYKFYIGWKRSNTRLHASLLGSFSYLDIVNGIRGLDLECDGLASEGLHEDLLYKGFVEGKKSDSTGSEDVAEDEDDRYGMM